MPDMSLMATSKASEKCRHKRHHPATDRGYVLLMATTPLKALRKAKGFTQVQVAEGAGMSRSHYAEIESGKKPFNNFKAARIAQFLEVEPGALYPSGQVPDGDDAGKLVDEIMGWARRLHDPHRLGRVLETAQEQVALEELDRARELEGGGGDAD